MNKLEARREAKRRWGTTAYVTIAKHGPNRYVVGLRGSPGLIIGFGPSWEAAFDEADTIESEVCAFLEDGDTRRDQRGGEGRAMSHTPVPWTTDRNHITTDAGEEIATVSYQQSGYVQANIRLIVTAPRLLAAAKRLIAPVPGDTIEEAMADLQAAVEQAEGRETL